MTTFTFSGVQVDYDDNGDAHNVQNADTVIVVPSATSTFSYSIDGRDEDGVAIINMNDEISHVIMGGQNLDDAAGVFLSEESLITSVTWSGGTSVVLIMSMETGPNTDTEFYFVLDGAALPDINSVADWTSFDNSITSIGDPVGAYGPGSNIAWSSIDGVSVTEDDEFWGTPGDDAYNGGKGDDYFLNQEGNDTYNGGNGRDEVRYDQDERFGGEDGVTVNLSKGFAIDGFGDRDTLRSIENARGSDSADKLLGNKGGNRLTGLDGNDTISGKGGNDLILGGNGRDKINGDTGNDDLFGEGGADLFIFKGSFGNDTISDFQTAGLREKVDLSSITNIKSFRDLKNNHLSENTDGDVVISDNKGNSITMDGIGIADLSGNDFIF